MIYIYVFIFLKLIIINFINQNDVITYLINQLYLLYLLKNAR